MIEKVKPQKKKEIMDQFREEEYKRYSARDIKNWLNKFYFASVFNSKLVFSGVCNH